MLGAFVDTALDPNCEKRRKRRKNGRPTTRDAGLTGARAVPIIDT